MFGKEQLMRLAEGVNGGEIRGVRCVDMARSKERFMGIGSSSGVVKRSMIPAILWCI